MIAPIGSQLLTSHINGMDMFCTQFNWEKKRLTNSNGLFIFVLMGCNDKYIADAKIAV